MSRSSIDLPLRILAAHNKVIEEATSKKTANRVSREVFQALREGFYARTDARAQARPESFHHVYEWGQTGNSGARLFELVAVHSGTGDFAISYKFLSSRIPSPTGSVFADKARVMETGEEVTIRPVNAEVLSFDVNGEQVFTRGPVVIPHPGGEKVRNALRNEFMFYFRPSILAKNPAYQAVLQNEMERVLRRLGRVTV